VRRLLCEAACPVCFNSSGNYVCSPAGCQSGQPASFVGKIFDLNGTAVAGLAPSLTYTLDGSTSLVSSLGTLGHYTTTPFAFNAFQPVETQTGSDQTVATSTTFLSAKTDTETPVVVDVTYANVNAAGTTTVTAQSAAVGALPSLTADIGQCSKTKKLACETDEDCPSGQTCIGYHGFFFDTTTTAGVSPPFTVCSHYPDNEKKPKGKGGNGYVDGTGKPGLPETSLRMLHDVGGTFVDVTLPGYPDTVNNIICGQVDSLSNFGQAVKTDMPGGKDASTDCMTEWSLCDPRGGGNVKVPKKKRGAPVPVPDGTLTCAAGRGKCKGADPNTCSFCFRVCPNVADSRLSCSASDVQQYLLTEPLPTAGKATDSDNANNVLAALEGLSSSSSLIKPVTVRFSSPVTASACSGPITFIVPKKVTKHVKLTASSSSGGRDQNQLTLVCK
jgi:hypothetical protein